MRTLATGSAIRHCPDSQDGGYPSRFGSVTSRATVKVMLQRASRRSRS